ncbi:MAG TPA: lipid A biosynthesis acyltransferase, partial [Puia sp.]|nr:lipid A biosynthesis acyltransferase [Puia sp.]
MYYILYGILYLFSLLPMPLLYLFSDGLFLLTYYVIGYRKKVTMDNLAIVFPQKSEKEKVAIAKAFYRNFVDNFIETIKLFSASNSFIKSRFQIDNPEMYQQFYEAGRKCQLHLGHTFNWELANIGMPLQTDYRFIVVYMPIANKAFEKVFKRFRSRTGTVLLPATQMSRSIVPYRKSLYMLALVADQAPGNPGNSYWLNFFGCPTPFVRGPERGARTGNIPAIFA